MIIEIGIGLLVIATVVYLFWQSSKSNPNNLVDVNKDGKVNVEDAKAALDLAVNLVVEKVDVNQDGKVSVADAQVVAEAVKQKVKEKVAKPKTAKAAKAAVEATPVVAETTTPKRARKNGKLVADNPATPDVNEAWEGGKAPAKKEKPKKPKKPKMTVVK